MSDGLKFIESLTEQGVTVWVEGSRLRYRATKGVLTEVTRRELAAKKSAIVAAWREQAARTIHSHPVSYGQRALWFLQQTLPKSAAYNVAFSARIRSPLDLDAFRYALQALVDRHPSLRTTYTFESDTLVQQMHGHLPVSLSVNDRPGAGLEELKSVLVQAYRVPFDLVNGPVMRVDLFSRGPEDHVFLLTVHHIAADGWSLFLLLDDLRQLYRAELGVEATLTPRPQSQVADFAVQQQDMLAGPNGRELESYWLKQLSGELPPLSLHTDRPRPAVMSDRGASLAVDLGLELSEAVRSLAAAANTTPFVVLLAAYQLLLHRCSCQNDIIVGSPTYGRDQSEFSDVVGDFINMIPLRARFTEDVPFKEFLSQMRQTVQDGIQHQDYPFPRLVEKLQPVRDSSRTPVFQTLFVLQKFKQLKGLEEFFSNSPSSVRLDWGGLALEPFSIPQQEGQFDLSLELVELAGVFGGALKYNTDLYDAATIEQLGGHFKELLRGIVASPQTQISRLPLLSSAERYQMLEEWNATARDYPQDVCLHQLIEAQIERTPEAVAVVFGDQKLTYRELDKRANQLAHFLQKRGVKADTLVGISVERSPEMVVGLLGILKAGGAYVPLDPSYPQARLAFMLEDAGVSVLLTQKHLVHSMPSHQVETVCLDGDGNRIADETTSKPEERARGASLAYMIYTSGSTGQPKGAMNAHRGIVNRLLWMQDTYHLNSADAVLQKTPFGFDVSVWEFFWPLLAGARLVIARPGGHQDPTYLIDVIAREHITIIHFVPSMLRVFLEADGVESCSSLREVICSGEALPPDAVRTFHARCAARLHNLYGPTEAAVDVTYWPCPRKDDLTVVPIGRPVANTQCYILDQQLQPVPIGVPGELYLGGIQVGLGYHNRPELTAEKFISDPFREEIGARLYRTGDLCRRMADGNIEYLGRLDHQVKIRGFRIELGEVEAAIGKHRSVKEVVVVAREVSAGDQRLVAYLVPREGGAPAPGEMREYLLKSLPDYMVPSTFVPLEELPLSPNGKIDRNALPTPADAGTAATREFVPPETATEKVAAQIFAEVLNVPAVGIYHNFFELGGHSLLATRVVSRLGTRFQIELSLRAIFEFPTVQELSQYIDTVLWTTRSATLGSNPSTQERVSIEI